MIQLGDTVIDSISGLVGVAVSKTEYINGCVNYGVMPKLKKGATEMPSWNIDEAQLSVVKKKTVKIKKKPTGGPTTKII